MQEYCSSHVPEQWQSSAIKSIPVQFKEDGNSVHDVNRDRKSDLIQWNNMFGPCSGAWTVCGDDSEQTEVDAGLVICPELVGSIHNGGLEEDEVLPSTRLPGALEIEPVVRKHTGKVGLISSDNAIWMLVVAVREHSLSLIKKVIANDKDFRNGYAPSLPINSQTSLACIRLTPKDRNQEKTHQNFHKTSGGKSVKSGKKVINSISLSHVLAETLSAASRLTSNRSIVISDERGFSPYCLGLDNANCIINASIQRGASKRQRSFTSNLNVLKKATTSSALDFGPNKQSAKTQPSTTQSLPTTLLPLLKPQLGMQTRNLSIPTPIPPLYHQSRLFSIPPQNIHPPNLAQMMNHSDHTTEIPFGQQNTHSLEPLTKPRFLDLTDKPFHNPAPSPDFFPPRAVKRGAKDLATMMASPPSQSNLVNNKANDGDDGKNNNGATPDKTAVSNQKEQDKKQKRGAKDKKDDTAESTLKGPSRPKGRGFGVKNLSKMRARVSGSGK